MATSYYASTGSPKAAREARILEDLRVFIHTTISFSCSLAPLWLPPERPCAPSQSPIHLPPARASLPRHLARYPPEWPLPLLVAVFLLPRPVHSEPSYIHLSGPPPHCQPHSQSGASTPIGPALEAQGDTLKSRGNADLMLAKSAIVPSLTPPLYPHLSHARTLIPYVGRRRCDMGPHAGARCRETRLRPLSSAHRSRHRKTIKSHLSARSVAACCPSTTWVFLQWRGCHRGSQPFCRMCAQLSHAVVGRRGQGRAQCLFAVYEIP